jgi:hypothetical protein
LEIVQPAHHAAGGSNDDDAAPNREYVRHR